jgi:hypothetical protein
MENQNYNATFTVSQSANKVFESINTVTKWWTENLEGSSEKLNDEFKLLWGGDNFVNIKIIESVPFNKIVWHVTDCYLEWLKDKHEWTNTKMSFEISTIDNSTQLHFTHIGLVPEVECYNDCVKGWDQYVKGSLLKLIEEGEGQPQKRKQ